MLLSLNGLFAVLYCCAWPACCRLPFPPPTLFLSLALTTVNVVITLQPSTFSADVLLPSTNVPGAFLLLSIPAAGTHWQLTFIAGAHLPSPATTQLSPTVDVITRHRHGHRVTVVDVLRSSIYAVDASTYRGRHLPSTRSLRYRCRHPSPVYTSRRRPSPAPTFRRRPTTAVDVLASHTFISNSNADRCLIPVRSCSRSCARQIYCCVCCFGAVL